MQDYFEQRLVFLKKRQHTQSVIKFRLDTELSLSLWFVFDKFIKVQNKTKTSQSLK